MVHYPLSTGEDRAVRWFGRVAPAIGVVVLAFLVALSIAAMRA
jgi:hypothetical protein